MIVRESILRDGLRLFVWYPFRWVVERLPVRWGIRLLSMMGDAHYAAARGEKQRLTENLARIRGAAGGAEPGAVVREYFRNHYVDRLLIFIFPRFGVREAERLVEIDGIEHLDAALERGKGAVLVHGHLGPVHVPLVVLARLGYPMKQIGLPSDEGLSWVGRRVAFTLRLRYESRIPAEIIKADGFLRPAFRWLAANGVIMITGDGSGTATRGGRNGIFSFFGHPVAFPLGPALLAGKTGAVLMPMFMLPGNRKLFRIVIEPPLDLGNGGEEMIREATGRFVGRLEDYISRFPGYMHFLDRFAPGTMIEPELRSREQTGACARPEGGAGKGSIL